MMPDPDDLKDPAGRRGRDRTKAIEILKKRQDGRIYGIVSFHLQAGRIVRAETMLTEDFRDP